MLKNLNITLLFPEKCARVVPVSKTPKRKAHAMMYDLANVLTALGHPATVEGNSIKCGGERITCGITGKVVASNSTYRTTLGTVQDSATHLAGTFINYFF